MKNFYFFRLTAYSGIVVLVLTVLISQINPSEPAVKNPGKFHMPILALELAQSVEEVFMVTGSPGTTHGIETRQRYINGTYIDFLYLLAYTLFTIGLGGILWQRKSLNDARFYALFAIALVAGIADALENVFLLNILRSYDAKEIFEQLYGLQLSTYIKWISLGLGAVFLAYALMQEKRRAIAIALGAVFGFSVLSLFYREAIEGQVVFLGVSWAILWYKSLPTPKTWFPRE